MRNVETERLPAYEYIGSVVDHKDLNYAVESRGYPLDPNLIFVTCRGGGLTVMEMKYSTKEVAFSTSSPLSKLGLEIIGRWDTAKPLERQDRFEDVLVVAEIGRGPDGSFCGSVPSLHFLHVSRAQISNLMLPFASIDLSKYIDAILHVKFLHWMEHTYAVCTGGFASTVKNAIVIVDVTKMVNIDTVSVSKDFKNSMRFGHQNTNREGLKKISKSDVLVIDTGISQPEGVHVMTKSIGSANIAASWIGGIASTNMAIVDMSFPLRAKVHMVLYNVGRQLVPGTWHQEPFWADSPQKRDDNVVYLATWGIPGGVVAINASNPLEPIILRKVQALQLSMANRIRLHGDFLYVPLELPYNGGFAVVNIHSMTDIEEYTFKGYWHWLWSAPSFRKYRVPAPLMVDTKAYCLSLDRNGRVFLFTAKSNSVHVFQPLHCQRDKAEKDASECNSMTLSS